MTARTARRRWGGLQGAALAAVLLAAPAGAGLVPLFDGKTLDGWVQRGGAAKYRVEDGCIVGTSAPNTGNSFLCTRKAYGDFTLTLDFKVHPELNSGVQVRSQYAAPGSALHSAGKAIAVPAAGGRVFGYQIEIDPSARSWSGGIYDEGRRAWLRDLKDNEPARRAFKPNDWNAFRIECRGAAVRTWINGVPAAEIADSVDPRGFIALQVHGVGSKSEPLEVRWRNLWLEDFDPPAAPAGKAPAAPAPKGVPPSRR
jgi:hypothetical protein